MRHLSWDLGSHGKATPCAFHHKEWDIRTVVHGDDFTSLGDGESLQWLLAELQKQYELKLRATLGPDAHDDKDVRILNRVVQWTQDGITYEPDQRHADIVVRELGLAKAKGVSTPGVCLLYTSDAADE